MGNDGFEALNSRAEALGSSYAQNASLLVNLAKDMARMGFMRMQAQAMLYLNRVPKELADAALAEAYRDRPYPEAPLASRRVTALPIKYGSRVKHVAGTPEGKVIIVVGDGMYIVKWDSGIEERIHESEIVVLEQPPRPTLPLFDSKLEGALKSIEVLTDTVNGLAMLTEEVMQKTDGIDKVRVQADLRRIRTRIAPLIIDRGEGL